ncbi:ribbon-helix-helix domain-containing protein [Bradyrhizobium guangxiense]|uniref:ribbon-helix-helix domain-containing protein n=1 Tax=Bradyrhizobium guangxiense TaxID=1325115 RepID=UPI00100924DC|nr:ribbon-helix-helix domain-containing protein [Bradyrhizobium guangxiense]
MAKKTNAKSSGKSSSGMKYVQTRLTQDSWRDLQTLRIEKGESLQSLIVEALNDLMAKNGKKRSIVGANDDEA